jgi:hypothetical protein
VGLDMPRRERCDELFRVCDKSSRGAIDHGAFRTYFKVVVESVVKRAGRLSGGTAVVSEDAPATSVHPSLEIPPSEQDHPEAAGACEDSMWKDGNDALDVLDALEDERSGLEEDCEVCTVVFLES